MSCSHHATPAPDGEQPARPTAPLDPESKRFYDTVDRFIDLCNELSRNVERPMVSAAVLYAAARYNAFHFQASRPGAEPEEALSYLGEQFIAMLKDNLALPLATKAFNDSGATASDSPGSPTE